MNLLAQIQTETVDYSGLKVLLPLSGGINSAALLCWLGEEIPPEKKPDELDLYFANFAEHSPDTGQFGIDLFKYAQKKFRQVNMKFTWNSVNHKFRKEKFIPHPSKGSCSQDLKIEPMLEYKELCGLDVELIGYVKTDIKRFRNTSKRKDFAEFPVLEWSKQDCLYYVKKVLGWYPAIYDIKENGKDVFSHNNCLPCKNMHPDQLAKVTKYYPKYAAEAEKTAQITGGYWGREDVPDVFKCDVCERMD